MARITPRFLLVTAVLLSSCSPLAGCAASPPASTIAPTLSPVGVTLPTPILITAVPPPTKEPTAMPQPTSTLAPRAEAGSVPWSLAFADYVLSRWPQAEQIVDKGWEYNTGIVLYGLSRVYEQNGDPRLLAYIQEWVDAYVGPEGQFTLPESDNLDLVQPANLLLFLYEQTGEARYLTAARTIADDLLANHPHNQFGGFWHKDIYPNQMWLDGVYMAGPFLVRLSALTGEPAYADTATRQVLLLAQHAQDPETGLLRHAWDASGAAAWAEADTGLSPVVWSRAMGWYVMALVDMLQALPADHADREALLDVLWCAAEGLAATQDSASGLWFQVMDQPDLSGNWLETSGSAMIIYALQMGVEAGYLDATYADVAARGWQGLQASLTRDADGAPVIGDAVAGMGVQVDAAAYLDKRRLKNSPHGLVGILLAATAMEADEATE